jgi:hypothetical protein
MLRMRRNGLVAIVLGAVCLSGLATGCSDTNVTSAPPSRTPQSSPTTAASDDKAAPSRTRTPTPTPPKRIPRTFDRKNFEASPIDINPWMPMAPGIQSVSEGFVNVGDRRLPHVRVTTVTDVTKIVDGVRSVLVLDQDFDGGQLSEQAVDYLAEDVGGNVWYVGSYTEVYEGGQFLNAEDAWLADVNGAVPGLYMPADPKPGSPPFYQTRIPGGEQSSARVIKVGQRTCVPFKCYTDVVVIQEQGTENKYWAPGVGQILTEPVAGAAQEIERLVNIRELSRNALAELSREALRLDRSAAVRAPSVFARSKPATRDR